MSFMDTGENPSSSYNYRGGRNTRGGGRTSSTSHSGRGGSYEGRGNYNYYNGPPQYNQAGRGGGRNHNTNYSNGDSWNGSSRGSGGGYRGRNSTYWGNNRGAHAGRGWGRGRTFDDPKDVRFVRQVQAHESGITAIAMDSSSGQLFTGSKDKTVRLWDLNKIECVKTVEVGGYVDSMLMESAMLFVGIHQSGDLKQNPNLPGSIIVYNMQAGSQYQLAGHMGPVYCLAAGNNMLFSGGHDHSIKVWRFNQPTGSFELSATLTAAQDGHSSGVKALQVINSFLFSADFAGCIKVWELNVGQCVQTIQKAHSSVIMSLLAWEGYLVSGSVDGIIRIWQPCETPGPGAVLDPQPAYSHPPSPDGQPKDPEDEDMYGKVLALGGTTDEEGRAVLLSSYGRDNVIRLWQLPDFSDRGHLNAIRNSVAIVCCESYLLAGDYITGALKVWRWKTVKA